MNRKIKTMAASVGDRLSELPEPLLIHILSLLRDMKEIARTSVLSTQWRFLWKSVPLSLFYSWDDDEITDSVSSVHGLLYCARFFMNTRKLYISTWYEERIAQDVDEWVHFATQMANVEEFTLCLDCNRTNYEFPQFAYNNLSLEHLDLKRCILNPSGSISWTNLISLSIGYTKLTDEVTEKILSGCPYMYYLKLDNCEGIHRLEINSLNLEKLIIEHDVSDENALQLEILAPHLQNLYLDELSYLRPLRLKNVASLVTASLDFSDEYFRRGHNDGSIDKEGRYLKELLHSLVHVKNLQLGRWCIQRLSKLVVRGLQIPASSRRILTLEGAFVQQDFPAICSLLQSSPDLETFVIDGWWRTAKDKDEDEYYYLQDDDKKFENHIFDCSLLNLRTIKIINFHGTLSSNKFILRLVKYLLKNAEVLEKMVLASALVSEESVKMEQEILSFPRSSKHAAVVFSYSRFPSRHI